MSTPVHLIDVVIRYFTSTTAKEAGSVVIWRDAPLKFSGTHILEAMIRKGVPLKVCDDMLTPHARPETH
jgi:hypothetical protein